MNEIRILDCTLRDGGYCNEWRFGYENITRIIKSLVEADLDIIECGFLTEKIAYEKESSRFQSVEQIAGVIPENRAGKVFVAMVNYGEFDIRNLPFCDGTSVNGLRIAFHKENMDEALELCRQVQEKGYQVFVQAMVSLNYSDEEFLDLIHNVNSFKPEAFYIVDSFGMMKGKDLTRLFYMVEHNLDEEICIGFHSHNNMQLAYSNAQQLVMMQTNRRLIIDSTVYGMGRGAGNLNTELFVGYLNENRGATYRLKPLLSIIDEILNEFYQRNYWGYSLPNYLSAVHNAHPNYAMYLDDKKTLTVEDMDGIFEMMDAGRKHSFDKSYAEELYLSYMERGKAMELHRTELKEKLRGKKVLLIAPGKSAVEEKKKIIDFAQKKDVVLISINFNYQYADMDFIFISNLRRVRELEKEDYKKCIITSNISLNEVYLQIDYRELINEEEYVRDNAGMMAVKFLILYGVKEIYLAGFDGYSHDMGENYGEDNMAFVTRNAILDKMNEGMRKMIIHFSKEICLEFLTKPRYVCY